MQANSDLALTNPTGGPLEPITFHCDFKRLLRTAGLPTETHFHDLRHTAASLLLAEGVHLRMIMELLGHSSISLTANTYAHVMPTAMRDVARKWNRFLRASVFTDAFPRIHEWFWHVPVPIACRVPQRARGERAIESAFRSVEFPSRQSRRQSPSHVVGPRSPQSLRNIHPLGTAL